MCLASTYRIVFLLFLLIAPTKAAGADRIALVIANKSYPPSIGLLTRPEDDARQISRALGSVGFSFSTRNGPLVRDAALDSLRQEIEQFVKRIREAGPGVVSFFYYAGHGAADASGNNFLIPSHLATESLAFLWTRSLRLGELIDELKPLAGQGTHFVVIDACRNEFKLAQSGKGFVLTKPEDLPAGIYLAFASDIGTSTPDQGVYATILADHIVKRNLPARTMFAAVARLVEAHSKGIQKPWSRGQLTATVFMAGTTEIKPEGADVEATGKRRLVFVNRASIDVHASPSTDSGIVETLSAGEVHEATSDDEINYIREKGEITWVMYQTNWGHGFVRKEYARLE